MSVARPTPATGARQARRALWLSLCALLTPHAHAQPLASGQAVATQSVIVAVDRDDSDDDGMPDAEQANRVPLDQASEIVVPVGGSEPVQVQALGNLRVLRQGKPIPTPFVLRPEELPAPLWLQAAQTTWGGRPLGLLLTRGAEVTRHQVHAVEMSFLDARNRALNPARDALAISQRVTSDASLPRGNAHDATSSDPNNLRIQILDAAAAGKRIHARLEAIGEDGRIRHSLQLALLRQEANQPFRSSFVRLVGDHVDRDARGVSGQVLLVAIRDYVRIVYERPDARLEQTMRVARPGDEAAANAARRASLRVFVLRAAPGAAPVIGVDDLSALRIVREEIASANEIWLQCNITFGAPSEVPVEIVDPPRWAMIAVADKDGLPARGGVIRLRIDSRALAPIAVPAGSSATSTALQIADVVRQAGFHAQVTVNPKTVYGAASSADVIVRRRNGSLAVVEPVPSTPLTTDPQQRIDLGSVELGDGVEEFDNMTAASGTLEERTLVKSFADDDPATVDLFIINRFTHGTRQGEAFIEASAGAIGNVVILDRTGLRHRETAWTMAHELGHVLLNQPLHPDNVGRDRPWLLMDSDNNRGTVNGPKRLTPEECTQARDAEGGPSLLQPYDPRIEAQPEARAER